MAWRCARSMSIARNGIAHWKKPALAITLCVSAFAWCVASSRQMANNWWIAGPISRIAASRSEKTFTRAHRPGANVGWQQGRLAGRCRPRRRCLAGELAFCSIARRKSGSASAYLPCADRARDTLRNSDMMRLTIFLRDFLAETWSGIVRCCVRGRGMARRTRLTMSSSATRARTGGTRRRLIRSYALTV